MGNAIGDARKAVRAAQEGKEASEERLKLLEKMVTNHLTLQKQHILNGERNDQEIHEGTIVREYQQMYVTDSRELSNEIEKTVDSLFSGDFLASESTNRARCSSSGKTTPYFFSIYICIAGTSSSKGVITEAEGVLGALMVQRVMNIAKVDPQVITWAICSGSSDEVAVKKEIDRNEKRLEFGSRPDKENAHVLNIRPGADGSSEQIATVCTVYLGLIHA
eukprot:Em0575g4a